MLALLCLPLFAQSRLSAEDFLDRAVGKTMHFHSYFTGDLIGIEEFVSRRFSVWRRQDGSCTYGRITIEEGLLCFRYDDDPPGLKHCWYVFLEGERIIVRSPDFVGASFQEVRKITDDSLNCPDPPTS